LVQRFCLKTNKWKAKHPKRLFARLGYTQVLFDGTVDNSLEQSFQTLESSLPDVLAALDVAANGGSKQLPDEVYNKLMWYCAYLWGLSPFAKAASPLNYVIQLDSDLKSGRTELLKLIGIKESDYAEIKNLHSRGAKFILHGDDYLQTMFRIMFNNKRDREFKFLRYFVKWTVCHSPIELPISDVAFLKFHDLSVNAVIHLLPISPKLVLVGSPELGTKKQANTDTTVDIGTLTNGYAEYIIQAICSSAITAIACQTTTLDVLGIRGSAEGKMGFCRIKNLDAVLSAGIRQLKGDLRLVPATKEQYATFCKSFVEPYNINQMNHSGFTDGR
jgi:hypothetical protein